jgi:hypothetical protein
MTFRQICTVRNNQIVLTLPPSFVDRQSVTVIVDDQFETKAQKLSMLKEAVKDPLFLEDIEEVQKDFNSIDHESL